MVERVPRSGARWGGQPNDTGLGKAAAGIGCNGGGRCPANADLVHSQHHLRRRHGRRPGYVGQVKFHQHSTFARAQGVHAQRHRRRTAFVNGRSRINLNIRNRRQEPCFIEDRTRERFSVWLPLPSSLPWSTGFRYSWRTDHLPIRSPWSARIRQYCQMSPLYMFDAWMVLLSRSMLVLPTKLCSDLIRGVTYRVFIQKEGVRSST